MGMVKMVVILVLIVCSYIVASTKNSEACIWVRIIGGTYSYKTYTALNIPISEGDTNFFYVMNMCH